MAPYFLGLTLLTNSFPPSHHQCRDMGNGGYGQFITCHSCCSFLLWVRTPQTLPLVPHEFLLEAAVLEKDLENDP